MRGWLLTVARNIVTDKIRARAARPAEVAESLHQPAAVDGDHAEAVVDSMVVMGAMEVLSDDHRSVLEEIYFAGRSIAETAEVLSIPPGTVKSRCYYALRALRSTLEPAVGRDRGGRPAMIEMHRETEQLGAYALGALTEAEAAEHDWHLGGCPRCRRELAELEQVRDLLGELPPEALLDGPPADGDLLLQRTLRQVREEERAVVTGRSSSGAVLGRRRWLIAVAAAGVAVALPAAGSCSDSGCRARWSSRRRP